MNYVFESIDVKALLKFSEKLFQFTFSSWAAH